MLNTAIVLHFEVIYTIRNRREMSFFKQMVAPQFLATNDHFDHNNWEEFETVTVHLVNQ